MKDTYATLEHLENFRKEFQDTKFSPSVFSSSRLNIKSGRTIDSDPIDLSDSHLMQNIEDHKSSRTGFGESFQTEEQLNHFNISFAGVVAESDKSKNMSSRSVGSSDAPLNLTSLRSTDKETSEQLCVSVNKHKQAAAIATLTLQEQNENITGNEWKLVQYKSKPKNRFLKAVYRFGNVKLEMGTVPTEIYVISLIIRHPKLANYYSHSSLQLYGNPPGVP
ncbi:unnamed protein product [Arctia plantaginis]|uniref:Uncharacterized protein n=1 Tax=Arctia plantaginis TaxID=874455 RepID=A0A8S0ZT95_ARCPL|nr:unnamed protein product [Arctia plantaginis]